MSLRSGKLPFLGSEDEFIDHTTYPAAIENNRMRVCRVKTGDKCQDSEFNIVKVEHTKN
jgi:hypothetical protein